MEQEKHEIRLLLDPKLHDEIFRLAGEHERSVVGEIRWALKQHALAYQKEDW